MQKQSRGARKIATVLIFRKITRKKNTWWSPFTVEFYVLVMITIETLEQGMKYVQS